MKNHFETTLLFDEERESVILQSIGDAVMATDIGGNIVLMNPVAENLTGWKLKEAEGKPLNQIFHIVDEKTGKLCSNPVEAVLKSGKIIKLDPNTMLISRNEKEKYSIDDSCSPIRDVNKNIVGVVIVFRDVTKQKQNDVLKEKITSDLIQRNKAHQQFASVISHDLRGPLSNIISLTALINSDELKEDEKEIFLHGLSTSAEKLNQVIVDLNEILNLGKQLGEKRELIHFSKLIEDIKESISFMLEHEKVHFKIDFSKIDELITVKPYMYSIFYNLISNSIKYRRHNVPLFISVESKLVNNKIILTFEDNGLGIDLDKRGQEMFGLYKRFHYKSAEGKGMGLYMVKLQVEKLGGKISVASIVNEGTEFTIELPNTIER